MSAYSNTIRVLSRSRPHTSKTLLPFLYQTATIQQWKPVTHPIGRRNVSYRPNDRHDVPFEGHDVPFDRHDIPFEGEGVGEDLFPTGDEASSARKTTITGSERAAFEKLYKKFNAQGKPKKETDHAEELDQIADEYYEGDEGPSQSLDKIFDAVLQGSPQLLEGTRYKKRASKNPLDLNALAQEILRSDKSKKSSDKITPKELERMGIVRENAKMDKELRWLSNEEVLAMVRAADWGDGPKKKENRVKKTSDRPNREDVARTRDLTVSERMRVDTLIKNAQTDKQLWDVLEKEVLEQIRSLDLDGTKTPVASNEASTDGTLLQTPNLKSPSTPTNARVLFKNYPHHLITAITTLRTHFPSSPLPLTIVPTLKALGRSPYALGATTTLYKHLLRTAWLQHSSYPYMDALLTDMNNSALDFDADVVALLDSILNEHDVVQSGRLGTQMQKVYAMDTFVEGAAKVRQWRDVIAGRVGVPREEKRQRPSRRVDTPFSSPAPYAANRHADAYQDRSPPPRNTYRDRTPDARDSAAFREPSHSRYPPAFRDPAPFNDRRRDDARPRPARAARTKRPVQDDADVFSPLVEGRNDVVAPPVAPRSRDPFAPAWNRGAGAGAPLDDVDGLLAEAEEGLRARGEGEGVEAGV